MPLGLFCPPGRPRQGCTGQALKLNDLAFLFKVRIPVSFNVGVNLTRTEIPSLFIITQPWVNGALKKPDDYIYIEK